MSSRDTVHATLRQLSDLRIAATEIEHELNALKREQCVLDRHIAWCHQARTQTQARRFWRGFGGGLFVVCAVWVMALGVAHLVVGGP